jgi:hypothetical protein
VLRSRSRRHETSGSYASKGVASRAAFGPPQRRARQYCLRRARQDSEGTRHHRRYDSTVERYGQPAGRVKRSGPLASSSARRLGSTRPGRSRTELRLEYTGQPGLRSMNDTTIGPFPRQSVPGSHHSTSRAIIHNQASVTTVHDAGPVERDLHRCSELRAQLVDNSVDDA